MDGLPKVGIVGVGRMGSNIGRRLKDLGYSISAVYDSRSETAREVAQELGAQAATSLGAVTDASDVILTVVTDDDAMRQIFTPGSGGLLTDRAKGRIFVNCPTITPQVHKDVERLAEAAGANSLEACMASSITQARAGTLYLMIGGRKEVFERVKPMLEKMSASLIYVGPSGEAAKVKALVNMVMNINTAGLAEGLGLGEALGLDLDMLRTVFSQTGANSRVLETDGADMQAREHECYFSAAHAAKDSGIALALARSAGLSLPLAEATKKQFERMSELGLGELDKSGIAELTFASRHGKQLSPV